MEERITLNLIYMGLISAVFAILLTGLAFRTSLQNQAQADLAQYTAQLSDACEDQDAAETLKYFATAEDHIRLFAPDGSTLYDSGSGEESISAEEALALPEIQQAISEGTGTDQRRSPATQKKENHCAVLLGDGSLLWISRSAPSLLHMFSQSFGYIIIIFLILIPLSFLFSMLLTHRLIRPIKKLPEQLTKPDFDPQQADIYPELVPLLTEITERRNEREAMRQEFTANVSHELKTPLTTISGYSEMIASGIAKPEDVPRFAEKIHMESERMQTLVGDIIELNALDSEVIHQHNDQVNLLSLVQDCVEQLAPQFSAKHLSVYVTGDGFVVPGNQRQLWELVYNLLDNARRYNVDGGMIRVSAEGHTLSVRDTGIGIAKEHQSRVFERFYRVDKSHSRATGGTGLGLSIVKHVAELHGATVELESTEHIGTEIRVRFPS